MAGFDNDVVYGTNIDLSNALGGTGGNATLLTNGQMLIASTALNAGGTHVNVGKITSPGGTITVGYSSPNITLDLAGGGAAIETIAGDTGTISGANVTIYANLAANNAGATVQFVNSGVISTFNVTNSSNRNTYIGKGCGNTNALISDNVGLGLNAIASITNGSQQVAIGTGCLQNNTVGGNNTCVGFQSAHSATGIQSMTALGYATLTNSLTGSGHVAIGSSALISITAGINCIGIGGSAGSNYNGSESNNIVIANAGVNGESNVMRLGTQGSGAGQVNQTYIAGVQNQLSGLVVPVTIPGAYPYLTLITDQVILVNTGSARTINLVASPVTGTIFRIKDATGSGAANNITITPNAGNIDGAGTYVINSNYGSVDIVYSGTQWNVL